MKKSKLNIIYIIFTLVMILLLIKSGINFTEVGTDNMTWNGWNFRITAEMKLIGLGWIIGSLIYIVLKRKIKRETND